MKIGWYCYGDMHDDNISVDGAVNIRLPIINKLINLNHEIHWLVHLRSYEKKLNNIITHFEIKDEFNKQYKKRYDSNIKSPIKDFINTIKINEDLFPDLDVFICELNAMGDKPFHILKLIEYYNNKNTKIILWDLDNLYRNFKLKFKYINLNINDFTIITPYNKKINSNQKVIYYPYNKDKEKQIIKGFNICYIGNDYKRKKQLKKFYDSKNSDIYGKYNDDEFKKSMKANFKGQIKPSEVHKTYSNYLLSIQIVKSDYQKLGLATQRINEVLESGTVLLIDSAIVNTDQFVQSKFIVNSKEEVDKLYNELINLSDDEYKNIVKEQRSYLQKDLTTYNDIIKLIENI